MTSKSQSLVERLRAADGLMVPYRAVNIMAEAADEIERLQAEVRAQHAAYLAMFDKAVQLERECYGPESKG